MLSLVAMFVFASCVDYSDATESVTAKVQVQLPKEFGTNNGLEGHTVLLQLGSTTYSAKTDAEGIATFANLTPDVYNI